MTTDGFAKWSESLRRTGLGVSPAELHGSITGLLCAGWRGHSRGLLASLALEADPAVDASAGELEALLGIAMADISACFGAGKPVDVLLPDAALALRANAVVEWCRGFLGGLGLSGVQVVPGHARAASEWLDDFGRIAATPLVCGEDDGKALDELLDLVRDGVAGLHAAFASGARS